MMASTNPIVDEINRLVALGILQDVVFPILNVVASAVSLYCILRLLRLMGYLPAYLAINLPLVIYFGCIYSFFLLGVIEVPEPWLRGPITLLLLSPAIAAIHHERALADE